MKKSLSILLTAALLAGCTPNASDSAASKTLTGTSRGMNGEVTATVTVTNGKITDVKLDQKETYGVGQGLPTSPVEAMPAQIIDNQSLNVDTITGATITSNAVLGAVEDAVKDELDVEKLKKTEVKAENGAESYETDVVVVGAGAAGMSAAITAQENGAKVLVLEKQGIIGGATTLSGGKLIAAGTKYQEEQGYTGDTPEALFDYLKSIGGDYLDDEKVKFFCDHALEDVNWLEDLGVEIINVEPIHSSITPWRVMNTKGGGGQTNGHGGQITVPLYDKLASTDAEIVYNAHVTGITTEDGKVTGVTGEYKDGSKFTVKAKQVILATGGYAQNREMTAYLGIENYSTTVPKGNIGEGITMGEDVGAQVYQAPGIQEVFVSYTCGVGINEESGLIVNDKGERVVDEFTYQSHVATALHKSGAQLGYYIASAEDPNETVQYGISMEDTLSADTPEELAKLMGVDPSTFADTVARYNELCDKGTDDDFGKPAEYMQKLEGKLYAIQLNPSYTVTFGGLVTDIDSHVLDANNQPIDGLYAAGETAFTGMFGDEYPSCGVAIGSSVRFGKMAGLNAAKAVKGE